MFFNTLFSQRIYTTILQGFNQLDLFSVLFVCCLFSPQVSANRIAEDQSAYGHFIFIFSSYFYDRLNGNQLDAFLNSFRSSSSGLLVLTTWWWWWAVCVISGRKAREEMQFNQQLASEQVQGKKQKKTTVNTRTRQVRPCGFNAFQVLAILARELFALSAERYLWKPTQESSDIQR